MGKNGKNSTAYQTLEPCSVVTLHLILDLQATFKAPCFRAHVITTTSLGQRLDFVRTSSQQPLLVCILRLATVEREKRNCLNVQQLYNTGMPAALVC